MIDETERRLAQAITDTDNECKRLKWGTEGATQAEINAADIAWVNANEAYVAAGYSLEAFEASR